MLVLLLNGVFEVLAKSMDKLLAYLISAQELIQVLLKIGHFTWMRDTIVHCVVVLMSPTLLALSKKTYDGQIMCAEGKASARKLPLAMYPHFMHTRRNRQSNLVRQFKHMYVLIY